MSNGIRIKFYLILKAAAGKFLCLIGDHDWTGAALEGVPPDEVVLELAKKDPLAGFKKYSAMYCKRCGKKSDLSI